MERSEPSYDVIEYRVELLLEEWGRYQRNTPSPWVRGYPSISVEGRAAEDYGQRTQGDRRRRWAWQRSRRQTETGGKSHAVNVLAPDPGGSSSKGGPRADTTPWPDSVHALDSVLAGMPSPLSKAAVWYWAGQHSIRSAAVKAGVSRAKMERRIERVRWYVAGRIEAVDQTAGMNPK